jgi:uncharacterized protein (UPF0371 family)
MAGKTGFDNETYLREQTAAILERVKKFDNKLYLEFGGKLCFDYHAARVLPGYDPNVKIRLLQSLKDSVDIVLGIYAGDIERGRVRGDFGITYDAATLKLIDDLRAWGLDVAGVVITRFTNQSAAVVFKNKLERRGVRIYLHYPIDGYPTDIDAIVSDVGFGRNDYVQTKKPIVVVTAPGPNSGKLSICLSQLYHEHHRGVDAGYAKFETFPIWNLPLKHPVNVAYEAATADILDFNLVDPYHLSTYNQIAINYNRDVESFPILKLILGKISGKTGGPPQYQSPTDMGVNRAGFGIVDDGAVQEAAKQELIRRYFRYNAEYLTGIERRETVDRVVALMEEMAVKVTDRPVVEEARAAADAGEKCGKGHAGIFCGAALELPDGSMVHGKNSRLLHAASSAVLNAAKRCAGIPDEILLLSPNVISQIAMLKQGILNEDSESLDLEETLIALSISAATNHTAQLAMEALKKLRTCEMHMTHIPTPGDDVGLKRLGVNVTTDGKFSSRNLFIGA